ncbi:DUF2934 domain-containing protein [Aestuariivirga litoralis]|nr:DUF2934 domain-containing protein [Aestuariivirga litoralis]
MSTEQIAALAHKFWEDEGRPDGRAESHWLRAVESLTIPATSAKAATPKAKAAPKKSAKK